MLNLIASSPSPSTFTPDQGDPTVVIWILCGIAFVILLGFMFGRRNRKRNSNGSERPETKIYGRHRRD